MNQITILLPSLRGGGLEKQILFVAESLFKLNFNVEILIINSINSVYVPKTKIKITNLKVKQIRYALFPLINHFRRTKPSIVFCADTPLNALTILAKKISNYPNKLIVSERNHLTSITKYAKRTGDKIRPFIAKYLYPHADLITTVSEGVAEDLIQTYKLDPQKVKTLYNMFDTEDIVQKSKKEAKHLPKDNLPTIVNIGRLSHQKDQTTLIKAFAILRKKQQCHLIILGEGEERKKLQQLIHQLNLENDVFMPGFVSNPYPYIAQTNLFVLTSIYEGLPGVLIEALAIGTSIVSTNCPSGPAEILQNGKYGLLTPVGNTFALADAMQKLLKQPYSPDILRARAMDFSIETLIPQYLDVLTAPQNLT